MFNVLIACECSQVYLSEFMKYPSFNPVSIDLLSTDGAFPNRHVVGDVFDYLYSCNALTQDGTPISVPSWDMVIAFPPCTYLTNAGSRWFNVERYGVLAEERNIKRQEAIAFVNTIWRSNQNVLLENPRGYLSHILGKPSCEVHPFYFGDNARKRTCFWSKGKMPSSFSPHLPVDDPGLTASTYIGADGYIKRRSFVLDNVNSSVRSRSFPKMASCVVAAVVDTFLSR